MQKKIMSLFVGFFSAFFHGAFCQHINLRIADTLCTQEIDYRALRNEQCKRALETLLQMNLADKKIPRIALCISGGGYRASISALGFLQGLDTPASKSRLSDMLSSIVAFLHHYLAALFDQTVVEETILQNDSIPTLLDCSSYCAALSGSSWPVAGWVQSGMSPQNYFEQLKPHLQKHIIEDVSITNFIATLSHRVENHQKISLVDLYGILLGQKILLHGYDNPGDIKIDEQVRHLAQGTLPLPLHTAIIGEDIPTKEWVEFTPFEVGSPFLNSYIPVSSFNKTMECGILLDHSSPESLSFLLGLWGSGFCLNPQEFIEFLQREFPLLPASKNPDMSTLILASAINFMLGKPATESFFDERLFAPQIANWTFDCPTLPMHDKKYLTLVDAGIDFRIPMPPLLRSERAIDIIIVMDASDSPVGTQLQAAQAYARTHNLPFPTIDYAIINNPCSVHWDKNNPAAPIIIYFPLVKNEKYANGWDPRTADFVNYTDFKYTNAEIELLSGLMKFTAVQHQPVILGVIKEWMGMKNN